MKNQFKIIRIAMLTLGLSLLMLFKANAQVGIGTNTLGYGNDEVDAAVMETVKNGNMSTLNCPEEVYLAEKLIAMNPWADMVRFARSGGEANSIAIRIARAASGRDKISIYKNLSAYKLKKSKLSPIRTSKDMPISTKDGNLFLTKLVFNF